MVANRRENRPAEGARKAAVAVLDMIFPSLFDVAAARLKLWEWI